MFDKSFAREIENAVRWNDVRSSSNSSFISLPARAASRLNSSVFKTKRTVVKSSDSKINSSLSGANHYSIQKRTDQDIKSEDFNGLISVNFSNINGHKTSNRNSVNNSTTTVFPTLSFNMPRMNSESSKSGFFALASDISFEPFANYNDGPMLDDQDPGLDPEGPPIPIEDNAHILISLALSYATWKLLKAKVA